MLTKVNTELTLEFDYLEVDLKIDPYSDSILPMFHAESVNLTLNFLTPILFFRAWLS